MVFVGFIGCIIGAIIGANGPVFSYEYSGYLAIAIIAALDSVFGGITSVLNGKFDLKIFYIRFFWKCYIINYAYMACSKTKCRYILSCNCCFCRKKCLQILQQFV